MPSVSYKFKADHAFEVHEFEGGATSISAAMLRQIVTDVKLKGSAGAFGLTLSNMQTGEGQPTRSAI
jgi:hypothetical protein